MALLSVINGKGGAGKSTTATSIAAEYVQRGVRCILVDTDAPQHTAMRWSATGGGRVPTVAVPTLEHLDELVASYDLAVLDTPGRDDRTDLGGAGIVRQAMLASDFVLVPVQPTPPDLWAAGELLTTLRQAQGIRPSLAFAVMLNRVDRRTAYAKQAREMLSASAPVLDASLAQRVDFAAAMAAGLGPTEYAPDSKAADEVRALVTEIDEYVRQETPLAVAQ